MAAPRGPVFVSVPTEFLMEEMSAAAPAAAALPAPPAANEAASAELARALCAASHPVILTEELGRNLRAVDRLVELAEALGAPVLDGWHADYVNFPRGHPLYAGPATEPLPPLLAEADFVLLVEAVAGWHPPSALRNTKVGALGEDPLHSHLPFWGFRADHVLTGDPEASLARLVEQVKRSLKPGSRDAAVKRWGERNQKQRAELQAKARAAGGGRSITAAWAAHQINQVLPPDAIVVNETISHRGDIARLIDRLPAGGLYEASYGGLGMGLGTALGVKYAHPDRPVVMLIGDGSLYYNPVLAAFGACQELALPMLVVMFDNAGYFSQKGDVVREFPQGWAVRTNKFAGTSIQPRPDYPALARAFGGYGEQVEAPREVRGALERGLQALSKGQLALINLVLDPVNN